VFVIITGNCKFITYISTNLSWFTHFRVEIQYEIDDYYKFITPRYSRNTAKVEVKHQLGMNIKGEMKRKLLEPITNRYEY
jgi:hypothetical protein